MFLRSTNIEHAQITLSDMWWSRLQSMATRWPRPDSASALRATSRPIRAARLLIPHLAALRTPPAATTRNAKYFNAASASPPTTNSVLQRLKHKLTYTMLLYTQHIRTHHLNGKFCTYSSSLVVKSSLAILSPKR